MSDIHAGDRVRVEFEGFVLLDDHVQIKVRADSSPTDMWVDSSVITVLAPSVKVGDIVTADNVEAARAGRAIVARRDIGLPIYPTNGKWCSIDRTGTSIREWIDAQLVSWGDVEVLRIGGTS